MQILSIGKRKRVNAVAFSPDGAELATASGDRAVRVWSLATGEIRLTAATEETSCGYDLAYLDRDRVVFAGTELLLWETASNEWAAHHPSAVGYRDERVAAHRPGQLVGPAHPDFAGRRTSRAS